MPELMIAQFVRRYGTFKRRMLNMRLNVELSFYQPDEVNLIRKTIKMFVDRKHLCREENLDILIERLSELVEKHPTWTHGAPRLRQELDDEDLYEDYDAQGLLDFTVTHEVNIPSLKVLFDSIIDAVPQNRKRSIEKLSLNVAALLLCKSKEALYLAVANIVTEFVCVYDVASKLIESLDFDNLFQLISRVGKFLLDPHGYEAQGSGPPPMDEQSFGALFRILATAYAFMFDTSIKRFPTFSTEWQRSLFTIYRNTSSVPELYEYLVLFCRSTYEFFQIHVLGIDVDYDATLVQVDATYAQWKKDLFFLESIYLDKDNGIFRNPETRRKIQELYLLGQTLSDIVEVRKTITRGAYSHFQSLFARCSKMAEEARKASTSSTFRSPPYMIQICGPSGIGKSTCLERTAMILNSREPVKYEEGNLLFTRKTGNNFWDGYHSQLCVVYDDLFQIKEVTKRADVAEEIIDVCNSVPLSLNMSEAAVKGTVMFNSKYVFATTNVFEERSIGIAHPAALWRRFGSRWTFNYPKRYRGEQGPDWVKMHEENPQYNTEEAKPQMMYDLLQCTLIKRNGMRHTMTFDEFIDYIQKDSQKQFETNLNALEVNRKYIASRLGGVDDTSVPQSCHIRQISTGLEKDVPYRPSMEAQGLGDNIKTRYELDSQRFREWFGISNDEPINTFDFEFGQIDYSPSPCRQMLESLRDNIMQPERWMFGVRDYFVDSVLGYFRSSPIDSGEPSFSAMARLRTAARRINMSRYQLDIRTALNIAFAAIMAASAYKGVTRILRRNHWTNAYEMQSNEFKTKKKNKKRRVKGTKAPKFISSADPQYNDDDRWYAEGKAFDSAYLSRIRGNMARIECNFVYEDTIRRETQNILFVTGNNAIATAHLLYNFDECDKDSSYVRLITATLDKCVYVRDLTWITPDPECGLDVGLLQFNVNGIMRPDITSRFVTEAQLETVRVNECTIMQFDKTSDRKGVFVEKEIGDGRLGKHSPLYRSVDDEYTVTDYLSYKCYTSRGDCGSVVLHNDASINAGIMGLHVAGRPHNPDGFAQVVTREIVDNMLTAGGVKFKRTIDLDITPLNADSSAPYAAYGEVDFLGTVSNKDAMRMPSKTSLIPSLVQDEFMEHTHEPAMLCKTDGISPVHVALKKANIPTGSFDKELFHECEMHMRSIRWSLPTFGLARTLCNRETVNGLPATNYLKPVNIHTSPGFPYVKDRRLPGKRDWLGPWSDEDESLIYMTLHFQKEFSDMEDTIASGKVPMFPFVACLKDEKRPKEKVKAGKTRLFSVGNQLHLLLARKYYGGYVAFLTANSGALASKVGLVMNGVEFGDFYQYMVKGRSKEEALNNFNDGDFSGFDDSVMPEIIVSFFEEARAWYKFHAEDPTSESFLRDDKIREGLIQTFLGPPHILGNMVYSLTKGNTSGGFATVHINGHANELAHRYTFCELARDHEMDNTDFDKFVNLATYGDDSLMCIGDEVVEFFNGLTIPAVFKEAFGMSYTTASKGAAEDPVRPRSEVDFCKRKFFYNDSLKKMVGRMDIENILETTNWIRKGNDDELATIDNIASAHREIMLHGRAAYEEYSKIFVEGCAKRGLKYTPQSYRKVQNLFYKNEL
jgi:hypothetical protein